MPGKPYSLKHRTLGKQVPREEFTQEAKVYFNQTYALFAEIVGDMDADEFSQYEQKYPAAIQFLNALEGK